jgi:outer membrane protein assembly factor BamA
MKNTGLMLTAFTLFFIATRLWCEPASIITEVSITSPLDFPDNLDAALRHSLSRYLQQPSAGVATKAELFLNDVQAVANSRCQTTRINDNFSQLECVVDPKLLITKINITGLPASIIEAGLRRGLPVQQGLFVAVNENFKTAVLDVVRARASSFLKKNGFYGAQIEATYTIDKKKPEIEIHLHITNGNFAVVNSVFVKGPPILSKRSIELEYSRMCLSWERIIEAPAKGINCYSVELERQATKVIEERFAALGYPQASVRIIRQWIDQKYPKAPKSCRYDETKSSHPRCVDLAIEIDAGPKTKVVVNIVGVSTQSRSKFRRFLSKLFAADAISNATSPTSDRTNNESHPIYQNELLEEISLFSARNLDERELRESSDKIAAFLTSQGYPMAQVVPSIAQSDARSIEIHFEVFVGQVYYVQDFSIQPAKYLPYINSASIEDALQIGSAFSNRHYSQEMLQSAVMQLKTELEKQGFVNPQITSRTVAEPTGAIHLAFIIAANEKEVIDQIKFQGGYSKINDKVLEYLANCDHYQLLNKQGTCHGSAYIESQVANDQTAIIDLYRASGYLYADVKHTIEKKENSVTINFEVFDQRFGSKSNETMIPISIDNHLIISGIKNTNEGAIRRLFPGFKSNSTISPQSLSTGVTRLRETGRFSLIDHTILSGEKNSNDAYFLLQLSEKPSLNIDTIFSISTDRLFNVGMELEEDNLLSSMLKLKLAGGLGLFWGRYTFLNNKIIWPWIGGFPFIWTLTAPSFVYEDLTHRPTPSRRLQSKISSQLEFKATPRLSPYIKYWLTYTREKIYSSRSTSQLSSQERWNSIDGMLTTMREPGHLRGVLRPGVIYSVLDNPQDPKQGFDTDLWVELSGGPLLGNPPFTVWGTQNRFFIPMGPFTWALQATFMRAFIVPSTDNWNELRKGSSIDRIGGDRSIRGYHEGDIGIEIMGRTAHNNAGYFLNTSNIELRFPLAAEGMLNNLAGAVFTDFGLLVPCDKLLSCFNAPIHSQMAKKRGIGLSIGASLRYKLPVGPISLDYGFSPLHRESRVHVLFGYAF